MTPEQPPVLDTELIENDTDVLKRYTFGTHRICTPDATLARLQPLLAHFGVTRVANVTGLDRVGIPVVMVIRPNSRSVSVSQGKGLTLAAAKASGVMEAAELWHAEHITNPVKLLSYDEISREHRVADPALLPRTGSGFAPGLPLLWIEGNDLMGGGRIWVPLELVSADYTLPLPSGSGCFQASSNGLASGNHPLEAICHGICEVVERDATTLWRLAGDSYDRRAVDPASVRHPECRGLLNRFAEADLTVRLWDTTTDVGMASFRCLVTERSGEFADPEYGSGCHPVREVALLRALTEAAQARCTYIAGARDDFPVDAWDPMYRGNRLAMLRVDLDRERPPLVPFDTVPSFSSPSLACDLGWILGRLRAAGIEQVIAVDLGKPSLGLPVARIVVPGLEGSSETGGGYAAGPRARRLTGCAR